MNFLHKILFNAVSRQAGNKASFSTPVGVLTALPIIRYGEITSTQRAGLIFLLLILLL